MQTTAPTKEQMEQWIVTFNEYATKLSPNRKTATELVDYIKQKYVLEKIHDPKWDDVVIGNVIDNPHSKEKINGKIPKAVVFSVKNMGVSPVFIGVELISGYFHVECEDIQTMEDIWDELFAFMGLDETDLQNPYLVAEYVKCRKKIGNPC